jgi:uncharacterized protein YecE (DUF72 family)
VNRDGRARVGCSGWNYPDWRGAVYPADLPRTQWFGWYSARFDTVELNTTFYRLPSLETVRRWAAGAPDGFCFAVKLGQFGSHRKKLADADRWLPNHLVRLDAFGASSGPTLVQLPPHWRKNVARLDEFLAAAPQHRRFAVELRDRSWIDDDVFSVLAEHGAALCIHDLLPNHPFELTTNWTYLRFHGPDATRHPYRGAYTGRRLWRIADRLTSLLEQGTDVYAYFNNDYEGHAVSDASWLRNRLRSPATA